MQRIFLGLLLFVPLSIIASYSKISPTLVFFLSVLAIIPLAKFIGEATEQVTEHTDPAFGGFLNATFGNATELIVGIIALHQGLLEVVRATIVGSIIGNVLLAIGLSMLIGGLRHKKQTFSREGISALGTTLLLSSIALIIPAFVVQSTSGAINHINQLSIAVSIVLLIAYVGSLLFSLHTHKHLFISDVEESNPHWSITKSILVLFIATIAVSWVSDILVDAITPVALSLGWNTVFVSIVFVAIAGNTAEYTSAITAAAKNRMNLSMQIGMGSAAQIAQFVAPVLVFMSFLVGHPMNLVFAPFELVAMVLAIFIANFIILDGESNWLEGLQLLTAYFIIAAGFFIL